MKEEQIKYLEHIGKVYQSTTTKTSDICRKIVFASIAALWVFFQKDGNFQFSALSNHAVGLLVIYIFLDIAQYFLSATAYYILHLFRHKVDNIGRHIHRVDNFLYFLFLLKVLYLIFVLGIFIRYAITSDLWTEFFQQKVG